MDGLLAIQFLDKGLFVFVLGVLIVFLGMIIIVTVISIIGSIMKKQNANKEKKVAIQQPETEVGTCEDGITDEVKAAIIAVITAYYFENGEKCEFKVKKIKRI